MTEVGKPVPATEITENSELACMQEVETHLQGYYDKEDLEPGFTKQVKEELLDILGKYYLTPRESFSVDVIQLNDKKLSVAISPRKARQCPSCLDKKLSQYSLSTLPVTWMYYCDCGWEGELD